MAIVVVSVLSFEFRLLTKRSLEDMDSTDSLKPQEPSEVHHQDHRAEVDEHMCHTIDCSRNFKHFQMYHLSKCAGSTLNRVLEGVLGPPGPNNVFIGEKENNPDPRYKADPKSPLKQETFIIGTIRNPFAYYRSLWSMHNKVAPFSSTCHWQALNKAGKLDLYKGSKYNVTKFEQWLYHILIEDRRCDESMIDRHRFMQMKDGSVAYDALIHQENMYPDLRKALTRFDCCVPGVVNWKKLAEFEEQGFAPNFYKEEHETPYHCFYTDDARRVVEENDKPLFERYGYSWESFVKDQGELTGNGECAGMFY